MDFELFDKFTNELSTPKSDNCLHEQLIYENGVDICVNCGREMGDKVSFSKSFNIGTTKKEQRYERVKKQKNIYNDVANIDLSDHIKDMANEIYVRACKDHVHRGAYRRAIIFASVFTAYKLDNNPQSCDSLLTYFKIKRRDALKGLKFISEHVGSMPLSYITPQDIIKEYMNRFQASRLQIDKVLEMYSIIEGRSSILNRSRPQSVAAGMIYYYSHETGSKLQMKNFLSKISISELTVHKICKEIRRVMDILRPKCDVSDKEGLKVSFM
jgi:transcription initiation factor TFIIIB Brf1 subunit/transcription initiation factor TFIIB